MPKLKQIQAPDAPLRSMSSAKSVASVQQTGMLAPTSSPNASTVELASRSVQGQSGRPAVLTSAAHRAELARGIATHRAAIAAAWTRNQFDPRLIERYEIRGLDGSGRESVAETFIEPLLDLLIVYVRTGETRYRAVYLDERLRYAPFRAPPGTRAEFFREVLPPDERAVIAAVGTGGTDTSALQAVLADLHAPLLACDDGPSVRVLAVGDCLLNEVRVFLPSACRREGIAVDMRNLYFSAGANRAIDSAEVLEFIGKSPMDLIAMSFLSYEGIPAYRALLHDDHRLSDTVLHERVDAVISVMREFLSALRERTDAPFLVHGASGLPLTRWRKRLPFLSPLSPRRSRTLATLNAKIRELVENTTNAIFIDEAGLAAQNGIRTCSEFVIPRRAVRLGFFNTSRFGEVLSRSYAEVVTAYSRLRKTKVLLVDFDDTLWRGVMADGPVEHYRERQDLLMRLKDAGIVLVAVSKNDPANIRWGEMRLKPSDFAALKISWNMKVDAIREAAHELDLGLDSMVLIDDNPAERSLVQENLPGVQVLDGGDERTWGALRHMLQFPNTKTTEEARTRTTMYQQQVARRALLAKPMDVATMMAGLCLKADFRRARRGDLDRIAELVQRTNQFNTTTIRYSKQDLESILLNPSYSVYVTSLSDKFGHLGLVAVAIIERRGEDAVFESLVMSCRAMGMQLERLLIRLVFDSEREANRFIGRFVQTDRNTPASRVFAESGFQATGEAEWRFERGTAAPPRPAWFSVSD
jgi:FkbH-like protein